MSKLKPSQLFLKHGSDHAAVHGLPSLVASMLMARLDFALRCFISALCGAFYEGYALPHVHESARPASRSLTGGIGFCIGVRIRAEVGGGAGFGKRPGSGAETRPTQGDSD